MASGRLFGRDEALRLHSGLWCRFTTHLDALVSEGWVGALKVKSWYLWYPFLSKITKNNTKLLKITRGWVGALAGYRGIQMGSETPPYQIKIQCAGGHVDAAPNFTCGVHITQKAIHNTLMLNPGYLR